MGKRTPALVFVLGAFGVVLAIFVACPPPQPPDTGTSEGERRLDAPPAQEATGPSPSELARAQPRRPAPQLARADDVAAFLDWAGAAQGDEREQARSILAGAANNEEISVALMREVERSQRSDYTRALLALALLGETRNPAALRFLEEFANRPLPQQGTVVDGQIMEQVQQAKLEAKAVDGLAFANTEASNTAVKRIIAEHPSRIVRAEAINAYLWNHGDSPDARGTLIPLVRPNERIFLQRVRRSRGEKPEAFNAKVDAFLRERPDAMPPTPEKSSVPPPAAPAVRPFTEPPPPF